MYLFAYLQGWLDKKIRQQGCRNICLFKILNKFYILTHNESHNKFTVNKFTISVWHLWCDELIEAQVYIITLFKLTLK